MKRRIVLLASLLAGIVAAFLTRAYIASMEDELRAVKSRFRREYGEMEALCLVRDTVSGTIVSASDLTTCKTYEKGNRGVVLTRDNIPEIVGRKTVGFHAKGDPLRWNDIEGGASREAGLSADVQPHFRAMSIDVNNSASVSGMVRPGDHVDVIGTFNFPDDDGKIKRGDPVTCTILQKVLVLATGSTTAKSRPRPQGMGGTTGYSTVTLAVTPREAEMLAFAEQIRGRLVLTLRGRTDTETEEELPTVDFQRIRSEIEELNKERNPTDRRRRR
jgi:pilus assembly protein CpaB